MSHTILLADDDAAIRMVLNQALSRAGYEVRPTGNLSTMWNWASRGEGDLLITDVMMPDGNAFEIMPKIKKLRPDLPIVVMSAQNTFMTAIRANEVGAYEYLPKPFDITEVLSVVARALADARKPGKDSKKADEPGETMPLVGRSAAMQDIYRALARLMQTDLTVTITGESGTGKELVARALHDFGRRRNGPFVAINMAAIPRDLIEAELFGHEKGAFTGAIEKHVGRFGEADGGTLFLDEIGELPLDAQVKLLRALQTGQIEPVGSRGHVTVDVRLIAATNRDLAKEVREGRFREDLFYRLGVVPVTIPPLRARRGDIAALARHFVRRLGAEEGVSARDLSDDALALLEAYDWPGNVRQLQNALFRAAVLCEGTRLTALDFPQLAGVAAPRRMAQPAPTRAASADLSAEVSLFGDDGKLRRLEDLEAEIIRKAIHHCRGRMSEVARRLGIGRSTLYRKLGEMAVTDDFGGHDDDVRNVA